jgi:serine/threonine protein kinase
VWFLISFFFSRNCCLCFVFLFFSDLKAANILFDEHGKAQICDFGLSESRSKIDLSRVFCGVSVTTASAFLLRPSARVSHF